MDFDTLLAWYSEERFLLFPVATQLVSMAAFALFATPLTWIAWKSPAWAERYRIQSRVGDPARILKPSFQYWLANNLLMFMLVLLAWPLLRLTGIHGGPLPPWYIIAGQVLFFIYLDDFLYYWMHRTLHHPRLYRKIHAVHHRVYIPWAITGHYMHPVEFILTGTLALLGPVLLGAHVVTVYIWIAFRQWEAAEGHSGYSFPWNPSYLIPFYGGTEYHDFHHAKFRGNYAGFLGYLDRFFGSYSAGYRERLAEKRAARSAGTVGEA